MVKKKNLPQNADKSTQAALDRWERILESVDELAWDELGALFPEIQKELQRSRQEFLAGRRSKGETNQLYDIIAELLTRIGHRIKRG